MCGYADAPVKGCLQVVLSAEACLNCILHCHVTDAKLGHFVGVSQQLEDEGDVCQLGLLPRGWS